MQTVTKITAQKRPGKFNVFLDGKYAFPVSESTLVRFRLTKDMPLDETLIAQIKAAEVTAAANAIALNYLARSQRSAYEVRLKLRGEQLPEAAIDEAIAHMMDLHYLNDAQYAQSFVADGVALGDKGPAFLTTKLRQKGVAADLIQAALDAVSAEQWQAVAMRAGRKAANQNQRKPYYTLIQKVRQAVMQKGFDAGLADAVVAALALAPDADGELERLEQEAAKQWRQKRKYAGYERRNRVKQALYRKGYQLDLIDTVLDNFQDQD